MCDHANPTQTLWFGMYGLQGKMGEIGSGGS